MFDGKYYICDNIYATRDILLNSKEIPKRVVQIKDLGIWVIGEGEHFIHYGLITVLMKECYIDPHQAPSYYYHEGMKSNNINVYCVAPTDDDGKYDYFIEQLSINVNVELNHAIHRFMSKDGTLKVSCNKKNTMLEQYL